ncbi:MAG: hypothetical protein ACKVRN_14325 [Pyrinomonadaceae bacterium]
MIPSPIFLLAPFLLGISGGLRSLVPGAVLMIAIFLDTISIAGTWFEFLDSHLLLIAAIVLSFGELIGDKLSIAPARTAWLGLSGRIVTGALCGVILNASLAGNSIPGMTAGAVLGVIGALVGTFGGFFVRTHAVERLKTRDLFVAIPEDLVSITLAICAIYLSV